MTIKRITTLLRLAALGCAALLPCLALAQAPANPAKAVYDTSCSACHSTGVIGAPKFGDAAQWGPRAARGIDALVKSAIAGTPKGMPPKGGRADLSDAQIRGVVEFMLASAGLGKPAPAAGAAKPAAAAASAKAGANATAAAASAPRPPRQLPLHPRLRLPHRLHLPRPPPLAPPPRLRRQPPRRRPIPLPCPPPPRRRCVRRHPGPQAAPR
jgi:cytochrome c5